MAPGNVGDTERCIVCLTYMQRVERIWQSNLMPLLLLAM